jgi:hypothetical protein
MWSVLPQVNHQVAVRRLVVLAARRLEENPLPDLARRTGEGDGP